LFWQDAADHCCIKWGIIMADMHPKSSDDNKRSELRAWHKPVLRRLDSADAEIAPSPIVDGITIS
jgi:hypothetical protein